MEKIDTILHNYDSMEISNAFFLTNDIERMRKFLVKNFLFLKTNELPGDIVELGIFKGTGFLQFIKLLEIYSPATNKKVIGFDLFDTTNFDNNSTSVLEKYYNFCEVDNKSISKNKIKSYADKLPLANYNPSKTLFVKKKYELIEGDVCSTVPIYIEENPGMRISLLYCDMDIEKPTIESLNYLYDRVVKGGIIVFDEYACDKWTESNAVDEFLKAHPELELKSITWSRTPTAYLIKK